MLLEKLRWTKTSENLSVEIRQSTDEGRDISSLTEKADQILAMPDGEEKEQLAADMIVRMEQSPIRKDFSYEEPETYEAIIASLTEQPEDLPLLPREALAEKLTGAWTGRACGCLLGIPVESWPRKKIHDYLAESEQFPLTQYMTSKVDPSVREKFSIVDQDPETPYDRLMKCWINNMQELPVDDDMNYTVLSLRVLERCGKNFTSEDVAESWLYGFPALHACTAERIAYRNLLHRIMPPCSGTYQNPYREWIGAQIRVDFYGYINPGNPRTAALMAYKDACVAQSKNGIYAAMMVAAMVAIAAVRSEGRFIITEALKQIPPKSRLHESVVALLSDYDSGMSFEQMIDRIHQQYNEYDNYDWCLAIPNLLVIAAVLLHYGTDYSQAICQAVLSGFDTDCNAATVGSILGYAQGIHGIDSSWIQPIRQIFNSSIYCYEKIAIPELVNRTIQVMDGG